MNRSSLETLLGAVVLMVAAIFLWFAYQKSDVIPAGLGYPIKAEFTRVDGLKIGNDVRISGVKVGQVSGLELNPNSFMADVTLTIMPHIQLPKDSVAQISNESLLGGRYIAVEVGAEEENIQSGGKLVYTQAAPNLEQLLGQAIFSKNSAPASGDNAQP